MAGSIDMVFAEMLSGTGACLLAISSSSSNGLA
jgi:hypothetical protein